MVALPVAAEAIRTHKLRSFLTLLGVVIGVATVVAVASVISGLNRFVTEQLFQLSPDVFAVTQFGLITSREDFLEALRRRPISVADAKAVERLCGRCGAIGMNAQSEMAVKRLSRRHGGVTVFGATSNFAELQNLDIEAGRFFTEGEVQHSSLVVVLGSDVRDELFGAQDPLGRTVSIAGNPMKVIGLLRKQGSVFGQSQDSQLWMPLSAYGRLFGTRTSLTVYVRPREGVGAMEAAMDEVRVILRGRRHTSFRAADPFGLVTAEGAQNVFRQVTAGGFGLVVAISGMSLVVGGIVIMNIMLVSVTERTKEIGLRRALGARRGSIRSQFLTEAILLSLGGGLAGVALGFLVSKVIPSFAPVPTQVPPALVAAGLAVAVMTGITAGLFPAHKAAKLTPVEALRHE
ncbi:MAG: ABC transporter permease [Acidobacteriota bacterium]